MELEEIVSITLFEVDFIFIPMAEVESIEVL